MLMPMHVYSRPNRLAGVPLDMFNLFLSFLSASEHALLSRTSSASLKKVTEWEQLFLKKFRGLEVPDTHEAIFSSDYVKKLTSCVKLRPNLLSLDDSTIRAIYWVNYHIGYTLLNSAECDPEHNVPVFDTSNDAPYQVPPASDDSDLSSSPTSSEGAREATELGSIEPQIQDSLAQSFDLVTTILRRAHQASLKPGLHPPLLGPAVDESHPNFHCDIVNVVFHSLRFIHGKPECAKLWIQIKQTLRMIIPIHLSQYPEIKAAVTKVLRPFLLPIADFRTIQPIHLRCLAHILEVYIVMANDLFIFFKDHLSFFLQVSNHCFNSTLPARLFDHLSRCADMDLGTPARPIPPAQVPLLALAILEVFPLLPDSVVCVHTPICLHLRFCSFVRVSTAVDWWLGY
jgi:hypothetical protein